MHSFLASAFLSLLKSAGAVFSLSASAFKLVKYDFAAILDVSRPVASAELAFFS